jgi:predicted NAD/FAD-dependent oxidoreductase
MTTLFDKRITDMTDDELIDAWKRAMYDYEHPVSDDYDVWLWIQDAETELIQRGYSITALQIKHVPY